MESTESQAPGHHTISGMMSTNIGDQLQANHDSVPSSVASWVAKELACLNLEVEDDRNNMSFGQMTQFGPRPQQGSKSRLTRVMVF
ncbi:hypothetical protein ACFX10_004273 [Malus domestica]